MICVVSKIIFLIKKLYIVKVWISKLHFNNRPYILIYNNCNEYKIIKVDCVVKTIDWYIFLIHKFEQVIQYQ